jgi:hypothetical protein
MYSRLLLEGKRDRMEGAVAKNFEEGKSHEQVREVGITLEKQHLFC